MSITWVLFNIPEFESLKVGEFKIQIHSFRLQVQCLPVVGFNFNAGALVWPSHRTMKFNVSHLDSCHRLWLHPVCGQDQSRSWDILCLSMETRNYITCWCFLWSISVVFELYRNIVSLQLEMKIALRGIAFSGNILGTSIVLVQLSCSNEQTTGCCKGHFRKREISKFSFMLWTSLC